MDTDEGSQVISAPNPSTCKGGGMGRVFNEERGVVGADFPPSLTPPSASQTQHGRGQEEEESAGHNFAQRAAAELAGALLRGTALPRCTPHHHIPWADGGLWGGGLGATHKLWGVWRVPFPCYPETSANVPDFQTTTSAVRKRGLPSRCGALPVGEKPASQPSHWGKTVELAVVGGSVVSALLRDEQGRGATDGNGQLHREVDIF